MRRIELLDLGVVELVDLVEGLEADREELRRLLLEAARRPMCGRLVGEGVSCQLMKGHGGLHAWASHDGERVVRWS
jgi:hypothetical protein